MVQYNSRKTDIFFTEEFGSYESIVRNNYLTNGYLIRTSAVRKFGGFTKEAPLEDWYLQLQLSKLGKYKYIDEVLFLYRCHSNNTATKKDYMTGIIQKTLDYEEKIVSRPGNEKWKKLFDENIIKKRYRIKLSSKFCWYRESKVFRRREIVVLFGKQFVISEKSYS